MIRRKLSIKRVNFSIYRANSNIASDKKLGKNFNKALNYINNTSNLNNSKKVSYIEKKEIYLHSKSKNSSIVNLSNNIDQTTLTKSLNNANQSKAQNSSKNDHSTILFELKNLDKIHHKNKDSDVFRFITSSIDRIDRLKQDNSKDISPNNITSNTYNKSDNYSSPQTNMKDYKETKISQALPAKNEQISFEEVKENNTNNKIQDMFASLEDLNIQGKSRNNQQRNNFVKNNLFNSEKNPSFHSNTIQKNVKEKNCKIGVLPRSTYEIENKTVHKVVANQKICSNFTLISEKRNPKKKENGLNYNNAGNNAFLTKIDNATKINFRVKNQTAGKQMTNLERPTVKSNNLYCKIDVKKANGTGTSKKQNTNKSISKEKIVKNNQMNQFRDDKTNAVKILQDKNPSTAKNNSHYLKKSENLPKYKGSSIIDSKLIEKNRKLSYDYKTKFV